MKRKNTFKLPSQRVMLFNGAALLIVAISGVMMVRSMLFHDDAPPCPERYAQGSQIAIEKNGQPLAAEELQARLSGSDWGLIDAARVVKLKSGPAPFVMEYALAKASDRQRPGMGFTWAPNNFKPVEAACLAYSLYLPEDFDFGKGGRLPGLLGIKKDGDVAEPEFSTRYAWRADGSGDFHTHVPDWTVGRPLGNDRHGFKFPKGEWVKLEQEVVLNDPGRKNGLLRIWVNGELKFEKSNVLFRDAKGPTAEARIVGVLSEVVMPADQPTEKHKVWLSPFVLMWQLKPVN